MITLMFFITTLTVAAYILYFRRCVQIVSLETIVVSASRRSGRSQSEFSKELQTFSLSGSKINPKEVLTFIVDGQSLFKPFGIKSGAVLAGMKLDDESRADLKAGDLVVINDAAQAVDSAIKHGFRVIESIDGEIVSFKHLDPSKVSPVNRKRFEVFALVTHIDRKAKIAA